jgi:hypothetical protein
MNKIANESRILIKKNSIRTITSKKENEIVEEKKVEENILNCSIDLTRLKTNVNRNRNTRLDESFNKLLLSKNNKKNSNISCNQLNKKKLNRKKMLTSKNSLEKYNNKRNLNLDRKIDKLFKNQQQQQNSKILNNNDLFNSTCSSCLKLNCKYCKLMARTRFNLTKDTINSNFNNDTTTMTTSTSYSNWISNDLLSSTPKIVSNRTRTRNFKSIFRKKSKKLSSILMPLTSSSLISSSSSTINSNKIISSINRKEIQCKEKSFKLNQFKINNFKMNYNNNNNNNLNSIFKSTNDPIGSSDNFNNFGDFI